MATEAEIPESVISITKREGEIIHSATGQVDSTANDASLGELKKLQEVLNVPLETVEYSTETRNKQAANDVGAEAMNTVIKVNVETPEGENFLESSSAVPVAIEDTCRISKNSEPKEVTLQAGNEMLGSNKQVEVTEEKRTEENKVREETDEKPEKNNMSHDIINLTGTSLLMAKNEESNIMIKEESLKEESIIENKEAEKFINLMDEVPEPTKPSERVADEGEKEKSMHGGAEETFTSTTDIKSDEEAILKIREEAGCEADEKLQEASSILCDEKSKHKIEPYKKIECMTPVEDEMNHKNNMDTESSKVVPKTWSDGITKESPDEVKEQIEMSKKTAESDSTSNETSKEYENPEQKGDGSFMNHEGTLSANELLPVKEASSGENRYEEESSVTATKDNIADTEIIDTFDHEHSGTSNSEERPENLQQNEPGKENLEEPLNVIAGNFNIAAETITTVKEETPIKIEEKSFEEEIKTDFPYHTEANVSLIELNEKTECGEVEVPNENVNDFHVTHALVEEAGQNEGKNLDEVFSSEPEACRSANSTILEQTSIEGSETTELIPQASETDIEKLQEASGPDFEEKSVVDDRENTDQKVQENGEACDTVTQEKLANSTDAGKCVIDAEASAEVKNAVAREEKVDQNIQVESPLEEAPELTGQDERCTAEDNNNRNNITNEEEHNGTKVAETVVAINEQVIEDTVTQISPESIDKQNFESCEGNKNVAENSEGENNREQVTEDSNIRCLLSESVEQALFNDFKNEKKEEEESTEEILENFDTAEAAESITHETIESPEDIDGFTVQQGECLQGEERNLTPIETSPEDIRNEGTSPAIFVEEIGGDSEPVTTEDNIETKIAESEEHLIHISQRNEPGEELPPSLSMLSDKEEVFNSDAEKTPGNVEGGPTQNLEEATQQEENEKETEVKIDTKYIKTAMEELYLDSKGGKNEETEKHNMKEECGTTNILSELIAEESLQSSKEENVDQFIELEEEKIEQSSQGDESKQGNDTYISPVLIEQETIKNSEDNKNKAENTGENDRKQMAEETNSRGLVPELVEQSPVKNLEDDEMKEDESTGEIAKNSKTSEVAESAAHATSTTTGSTTEILDTSLVKQGERLENEEQNLTASSAEKRRNKDGCLVIVAEENSNDNELLGAKDNIEKKPSIGEEDLQHTLHEKEPEEKHEGAISALSNENEAFSSNANKSPSLMEEGTSQDFDEALQKEDNDKETEEKNYTKDNNITAEENQEIVAESSDACKIMDMGMVLEPKLEKDRMLAQDKIKKEESEELCENSRNDDESKSEKHNTLDECSTTNIIWDHTEEKTQRSFKEEGKEETPKTEVCLELETTSVGEGAAEKQNEEGTSQDLDETPQKEHNDKETEEKNDTEDNKITTEESIEKVGESSDASEGTKREVLDPKSEKEKMLAQDEIKNEKLIVLYEDSKNASKSESDKHNTLEVSGTTNILLEPTEDKTHQNFEEEGKEEETLKTEACLELENTSVADAAEKQTAGGENTLEQSRELEENKVEKKSRDNDMAPKTYKEEECEITQMANSDDEGRQNIEKEHDKQAFEAEASTTGIEKWDIVQEELLKDQVEDEIVEENSKEDEIAALKLDDQVDDSNPFTQETEAPSSAEETVPETLKAWAESNVNSYLSDVAKESGAETPTIETSGGLIEEFATVSHMSNKETGKEIEGKEETTINYSDSTSITVVTEEKGLQEAESEDQKQIAFPDFEEKSVAEIETKETALETADDSVKPEDTSDSGEKRDNEIPTVADKAGETDEGLIKDSVMMSHMPNKEYEEEIPERVETTIEDSDSAPVTVVAEAKGIQEAEPEDKEQVESVGPTFEEKVLAEIETKVTTLEGVDNNVEPEVTSDLGEKRDNEIPTVADTARETNEGLIEESAVVSHASNKETEEEIKEKEETSVEDSDSAYITFVTEANGQQQAELEDKQQVETSAFEEKGMTEIEKATTLESVNIDVSSVDTTDLSEKRDSENPTIADRGSETNGGLTADYASVSHVSNEETEEEIEQKGEISIDDSDSASIIVETEEKVLQEAKPEGTKQVQNVVPASEEKCIDKIETKETTLESVDVSVKPVDKTDLDKRDNENSTVADNEIPTVTDVVGETNEGLIEESAMVSHTQDKETEEEIKENEETTIDDSDSASITAVTEAKDSQEAEPEDKKQVESVDPAFEEKGIVETKTKERTLESVDINVKAEDTSDLGRKRDKEISNVADAARATMDCEIQNDVPDAGSEDQTEVTTTGKFLEAVSKDDKLTTTDVSERVDETPAQDQDPFENEETTCVAKATDEMSMNKQDTIANPVNVSELESVDAGKETGIEEVEKQMIETEKAENFSKSEDEEISKGEETRKLFDQGNVYKSTTLKDVESLNLGLQMEKTEDDKPDETLKTFETSGEHTESEKVILEEEISVGNLKEVEVESADVEPEGEAHFHRHGDVNNTDNGTATEKKLEFTSEAVAENQTSETLLESDKSQMEEYSSDSQNQEHDNEIKEKEESQLEAEEHEEQNARETTKAVISTEKEREGVEQSDDSEDIKELILEEERGINELQAPSTLDETTDEMENSTPVSSEYDKAVGSKGQTKAENLEIEEESAKETDVSLARESEEQKSQDINIEPDLKESKEKIGDTVEELPDGYNKIVDAILTAKTEREAELGDKHEKDFHVAATEAENSQQVKEVDSVKLEETSELATELALNDNGPEERESIIGESKDVSEPEETKTASEAVSEFKDLATEEAIVGKSQKVEKSDQIPTNNYDNAGRENAALENSDADEAEETKIIFNAVDENKDLGAEETAEAVEGPTTVNIDQIPTSDSEHTQKESVAVENPKADAVIKTKLVSNATYESNNQETEESSGEISTVENRDVGEPKDTKLTSEDILESKVQGAEEAEVGTSETVEMPDQKPTNNDDNTERKNAAMENSGADEVETEIVADEIKVVSDTIYESKGQGAEEAEAGESQTAQKPDQVPTDDDHLAERKNEAMENSGADEVEKVKTVSDAVDEAKDQGTGEIAENGKSPTVEKMDRIPTSNCGHAQKESVAMENPKAVEVNEIKVVSDATYESNDQDTEEHAEEIPTVEKLDQTSAANSEQVEEDRVIMQYQVVEKVKDQITEDIDEAEKNSTENNPDANKIEEASKAESGIETVTENEVIADQTPSVEKLNVQLPTPTSTLHLKEETTATVEKIEEEKLQMEKLEDEVLEDFSAAKPAEDTCLQTGYRELEVSTLGFNINKEVQDGSTKVYELEGQNPDEPLKLEPRENENKIKCADSSSETDQSTANTDLTGPTEKACILESETSEKALQSEAIILQETTESEDTEIKDKHLEVISDVRTEEIQFNKICESNEIAENEVSKEEITEEKEVAETCQPFSPSDETLNKSLQADGGLKDEECRGDETNYPFKTTVNGTQYEEPSAETGKVNASTNDREQVAVEDTSVDDSDQVSVENKTIKESLPHEFEGKNIEDSAITLGTKNLGEESNLGSGKTEDTTPTDEESSMEMSRNENIKQFAKEGELIQETQGSEESSCEITKMQIPTQAELIKRPDTIVQIDNEYDAPVWLDRITETPQKAEAGDLKPGNAKGVLSEEVVKHEGEQRTDCSEEETNERTLLVDLTTASLSDLFQRSRKETSQVAKHVNEEQNQTVKPEPLRVKESKVDEEKEEEDGDEHNRTDSTASDAPVMVEASKDMVVKVVHKKSHNILSGVVGSKVKHSISKVKKAITGISCHSK